MVLLCPYASTTDVNPPLVCLLCGMEVPESYASGIADTYEHDQILKQSQWKGIWKSNLDHVMVPSHEIEEAYFSDFPRLWACFCRVSKRESDTKYRLTGIHIAKHHAAYPYYTPNDPAMARIGGRKCPDNHTVDGSRINRYEGHDFTQFYAANIGRQPSHYKGKLLGYIIHAHCWVLFSRIEGLKLKEAKLAKLVQVCRNHWRKNKLWNLGDYNVQFILPHEVLSEFEYGFDIYQNPLVVPEVQKAMNCANVERLRESRSRHLPSHFSSIPLEVPF
ncbi:hypothetical protein N7501_004419 [Penicillium viridicatum]|nr:hypothetical protein N7501_004419 [Penicillium viridicatum]